MKEGLTNCVFHYKESKINNCLTGFGATEIAKYEENEENSSYLQFLKVFFSMVLFFSAPTDQMSEKNNIVTHHVW